MGFLSLKISYWLYSPFLCWHERITFLHDEVKWGNWQRCCDVALDHYWSSGDMSGGSSASGLWSVLGNGTCGKENCR